jgi:K+-transporting ATPase A subunit
MSGDGGGFFNTNSAHPYANPTANSALPLNPASLAEVAPLFQM